jgi:hypothetical protein
MAGLMGRAIATMHPALAPPPEPKAAEPLKGLESMTFDQLHALQAPRRERI